MPSLKQLRVCCLLGSLLGGCASMQPEDPDRHAPSREMLNSIATVAVAEPRISGCHTDLSLHDRQVLKSMGLGAAGGALQGAGASGGQVIAMIFLVPVGLVGGTIAGAVAPETVPVEPTLQQTQAAQEAFNKVLTASFVERKELQSALISKGNGMSSHVFVALDEVEANAPQATAGAHPPGKTSA
jgi:hypothetical protein